MINVVLFDDHEVVLRGLENFLSTKEDIQVQGTATKHKDLFTILDQHENIDILVTDVLTGQGDGLQIFSTFQKKYSREFIIIAYTSIKSPFVHEQLKAYGVDAIHSKNDSLDELYELLLDHYKVGHIRKGKNETPVVLTNREREILTYIEKGLASKEIGKILDISPNTVHNHKQNLLRKYNCSNTIELISKAIKMGYLKL